MSKLVGSFELQETLEAEENSLSDEPISSHELINRHFCQDLDHCESSLSGGVNGKETRHDAVGNLHCPQKSLVILALLVEIKEDPLLLSKHARAFLLNNLIKRLRDLVH